MPATGIQSPIAISPSQEESHGIPIRKTDQCRSLCSKNAAVMERNRQRSDSDRKVRAVWLSRHPDPEFTDNRHAGASTYPRRRHGAPELLRRRRTRQIRIVHIQLRARLHHLIPMRWNDIVQFAQTDIVKEPFAQIPSICSRHHTESKLNSLLQHSAWAHQQHSRNSMGYRYFTLNVHSEFPASVTLHWGGSALPWQAPGYGGQTTGYPFLKSLVDDRRLTIDLAKETQLTGAVKITCTCQLLRPGKTTASIDFDYDASSTDTFTCTLKDPHTGVIIENHMKLGCVSNWRKALAFFRLLQDHRQPSGHHSSRNERAGTDRTSRVMRLLASYGPSAGVCLAASTCSIRLHAAARPSSCGFCSSR